MNPLVNTLSNRLSLRPPQRESLEILDRLTELVPFGKGEPNDAKTVEEILEAVRSEYPRIHDFEREFPSFCFALATGVGKTRLMGAFISYLYLAHGIKNFFVLAPGLTIYEKLITDFTPNTPKYVFRGISQFSFTPPTIITGDNYESQAGTLFDKENDCVVNIFNISKINSEVRGGKAPKIKQLKEYIGESYFDYLAGLDDLVMLMDESHRYRGSAGIRAINELKPILGLELTATPFTESSKGSIPFKNVILDYPLGKAMDDGFVKDPVVVTRENFKSDEIPTEEIERIKLEDGVRLHEIVKADLEIYARERNLLVVKPFVLVIARDTTHAKSLLTLIRSETFFEGMYRDKVIQVDSSTKEDEVIERLLKVEHSDEPTEIVIHVNMLKEGWDVRNLYTIIPLRAANARTLVEQSIGRGLRLPYGKRTFHPSVDCLNIIAHDRFKEIVEETSRSDSPLHLKQMVLSEEQLNLKPQTIVSRSNVEEAIDPTPETKEGPKAKPPLFTSKEELRIAQLTQSIIHELALEPEVLPNVSQLQKPQIQRSIARKVEEKYREERLPGFDDGIDISDVVSRTAELIVEQTIDIPRILVTPKGEMSCDYMPFDLDLTGFGFQPISQDLHARSLSTQETRRIAVGSGMIVDDTAENAILSVLGGYGDICYDDHADLLYRLTSQAVGHIRKSLTPEEAEEVIRYHAKTIGANIHTQMEKHRREKAADGFETRITQGFTELKACQLIRSVGDKILDFQETPKVKSNMSRYVFGGFKRCLYPLQKFDSDPERILATILDRESMKWFRPVSGQFQIYYRHYTEGGDQYEYQPDFVAEAKDAIYMLEPKASNKLDDPEVQAKKTAAEQWCDLASDYTKKTGGKPWKYVLIPHDAILPNMTLAGLAKRFG